MSKSRRKLATKDLTLFLCSPYYTGRSLPISSEKLKDPKTSFEFFIRSTDLKVNYFERLTTSLRCLFFAVHSSVLYLSCVFFMPILRTAFSYQSLSHRPALPQPFHHTASTTHFRILFCLINFYFSPCALLVIFILFLF